MSLGKAECVSKKMLTDTFSVILVKEAKQMSGSTVH